MTLVGTVVNGVIVVDDPQQLREGMRMRVLPVESENNELTQDHDEPTLARLLKYAGTVNDLPPDMAAQHDHYIHGTPKQ